MVGLPQDLYKLHLLQLVARERLALERRRAISSNSEGVNQTNVVEQRIALEIDADEFEAYCRMRREDLLQALLQREHVRLQYVEDKEIEDARKAVVEWRKNYTKHQLLAGHKARDAYMSWV